MANRAPWAPVYGDFGALRALVVVDGRRPVDVDVEPAPLPCLAGPAFVVDFPALFDGAEGAAGGGLTMWRDDPVATVASVTTPSAIKLAPPTTIEPVTETAVPARDPACLAASSAAAATPEVASVPSRFTVAPNDERPPRHRRTRPTPASPIPMAIVRSSSMSRCYSRPGRPAQRDRSVSFANKGTG